MRAGRAGCSWTWLPREGGEEIPTCLVHLFRVGWLGFFSKLSCDIKMETALSYDSLSVVPMNIFFGRWPAAGRAGSRECAKGQGNYYSAVTELLG